MIISFYLMCIDDQQVEEKTLKGDRIYNVAVCSAKTRVGASTWVLVLESTFAFA